MCVELVPEVLLGTNPKGFVCSSTATNDAIGLDGKGCGLSEWRWGRRLRCRTKLTEAISIQGDVKCVFCPACANRMMLVDCSKLQATKNE